MAWNQDLFTIAEPWIQAAKQARYKRELEEQLAAQQRDKGRHRGRRAPQPEFIIDSGSKALPGSFF